MCQALGFPLDVEWLLDPHGGPEFVGRKLDTQRGCDKSVPSWDLNLGCLLKPLTIQLGTKKQTKNPRHFHRLSSIVGKGGKWKFLRLISRQFGEEWASFYLNLFLISRSAPHHPAALCLPLHTLSSAQAPFLCILSHPSNPSPQHASIY